MKTKTGLKTAKNCGLWSFCGPVQSFDFWGKGRPVAVTVKALWHQKTGPDQTFKGTQTTLISSKFRVIGVECIYTQASMPFLSSM